MSIDKNEVTGLILAGGRGTRMGGSDKGLVAWRGRPLVAHVLDQLRPQVGSVMISANRNLEAYGALGPPVWPDELPGQAGPLAGLATGLAHCQTRWLVTAACDTPTVPGDLVNRLLTAATTAGAGLAMAATPDTTGLPRSQPVFALVQPALLPSLRAFLAAGGRKVEHWMRDQGRILVLFEAGSFRGANTSAELEQL